MTYSATLRVWRGDDTGGELKDFTVDVNEGEVVLDIIHRLQATQAPDLAVRWNCKAGKCGSCSAEINGRPRLMCLTRMGTFAEDEVITVTPLRAFPVIRDLVTDVWFNYEKAQMIPPFTPRPRDADGNHRMQQVDVERARSPQVHRVLPLPGHLPRRARPRGEQAGLRRPRFLMRIAELDMHPLDSLDRRRVAQDDFGLGMCNITKCCSEVCPEGIKITDNALIPMKERVVDRKYTPLTWLGSTIRRRGR
jgi:succinate dehydrogenase / fumarate reductase iron-sulfur subunit